MKLSKKLLGTVIAFLLLIPLASSALTIEEIGSTVQLGTADLKTTIINIILWVLGLLGLIAVIMILYGVFGSIAGGRGGDEERAAKAKRTIVAAIIGLVVIMLAWAIVFFVIRTTTNVTQ